MRIQKRKAKPTTHRQRSAPQVSKSGPSFSYHARRSDVDGNTGRQAQRPLRSPLLSKTFLQFWLQRAGSLALLAVITVSIISALSLTGNPKVVPLTDTAPLLQSQQVYQTAAAKVTSASFWNNNKVTFNSQDVSQQLLKQFPELANVTVTLPLLAHRPVIYIEPAQPTLILSTISGSYVLDSAGTVLLTYGAGGLVSSLKLPVVTDQSGLSVTLGHQALSSGDVSFIQTVLAQLAAKHVATSSLVLPAVSRELDIYIAGQPYFVKFNLITSNARQQVGTFLAALSKLQSQSITPAAYVDVRVDGRAYYQ